MKPDWDKLIDDFQGSATQGVYDVDCTEAGKPLCEVQGVKGFPTLKWGDPSALEDYKGGRDYDSLKKFADDNLKPVCSPSNIDLCEPEKKAEIEKFQAMPADDLDSAISEKEKELEAADAKFKEEVSKLQETYQTLMSEKEATEEAVKASGLALMKAVKAASSAKKGSDEL